MAMGPSSNGKEWCLYVLTCTCLHPGQLCAVRQDAVDVCLNIIEEEATSRQRVQSLLAEKKLQALLPERLVLTFAVPWSLCHFPRRFLLPKPHPQNFVPLCSVSPVILLWGSGVSHAPPSTLEMTGTLFRSLLLSGLQALPYPDQLSKSQSPVPTAGPLSLLVPTPHPQRSSERKGQEKPVGVLGS